MRQSRNIRLNAGDLYHLDDVYDVLGLIPPDTYKQGNMINDKWSEDDCGDEIIMLQRVDIQCSIRVYPVPRSGPIA